MRPDDNDSIICALKNFICEIIIETTIVIVINWK